MNKSQPVIIHPDGCETVVLPENGSCFSMDELDFLVGQWRVYQITVDFRGLIFNQFGDEPDGGKSLNHLATKLLAPDVPRRAYLGLGIYGKVLVAPLKYFCTHPDHSLIRRCPAECDSEPDFRFNVDISAEEIAALNKLVSWRKELVASKGRDALNSLANIRQEGWIQDIPSGKWNFVIPDVN